MTHDHNEDEDDKPHVHGDDCGCPSHGGKGLKYTPPAERTGQGLAAHMKAIAKGEETSPQPFALIPQSGAGGLKGSVMPLGAHADGGHVHGPGCGCDDHGDGDGQKANPAHGEPGHVCSSHHDDDVDPPEDSNNGLLKHLSSGSERPAGQLNNIRGTAILAAGGLAAYFGPAVTQDSMVGTAALATGMAWLAHESSEELMESIGHAREKIAIPSAVFGLGLSAVHLVGEGALAVSAKLKESFVEVSQYTDIVMTTTMTSNVGHIALATGAAGFAGAVAIDEPHVRKMNIAGMLTTSGIFGYQVATGNFDPWLSSAGVAAGLGFMGWRISAGISCAAHGDNCGHAHHGSANKTDYFTTSYWSDKAKAIKNLATDDQAFKRLKEGVQNTKEKIVNYKPPTREQIVTTLKTLSPTLIPAAALGFTAHTMGDSALRMAEQGGLGPMAMGGLAGLAFLAPELIFSTKAAMKGEREMAAASIVGCAVMGTGIVGGLQGLMGYDVPANLSLATTTGQVQMAALLTPVFTYAALTQENVAKQLAKVDNFVKEKLERTGIIEQAGRVSNWLNNDGTKIAKLPAAAMLAGGLSFYALNTLPNCHWDGNSDAPHCVGGVQSPVVQEPLTFER